MKDRWLGLPPDATMLQLHLLNEENGVKTQRRNTCFLFSDGLNQRCVISLKRLETVERKKMKLEQERLRSYWDCEGRGYLCIGTKLSEPDTTQLRTLQVYFSGRVVGKVYLCEEKNYE